MTKKEAILQSTLELYTTKGVSDSSTREIAQRAGVSEALIFKHFNNKSNLLKRILVDGYKRAFLIVTTQLEEELTPNEYLSKIINLPILLVESDPLFWIMQYKIIALEEESKSFHEKFMNPLKINLTKCLIEMDIESPELEAESIMLFIEGLWRSYTSKKLTFTEAQSIVEFVSKRYER